MDPSIISAAISGVVSLITGYMTYHVGMQSTDQAKPDDETIHKGEQAMTLVKTGVSQYGNEDEQADLARFERNPLRYTSNVERVLTDIATRNPTFAQQLQAFAPQGTMQAGMQGNVNVSGQGKIYGNAFGVNEGEVHGGTYNFNDQQDT
jgi:hypothetical protein